MPSLKDRINRLCAIFCAVLLLCGCENKPAVPESDNFPKELTEPEHASCEYREEDAVTIAFAERSGEVTVTEPGTYIVTGSCPDGRLTVDIGKDENAVLVLRDLTLTSRDGCALYVRSGEQITIVTEGENRLEDGREYRMKETDSEPDGTLFCRADLVLTGSGNLTVSGNYKHGIVSKDRLLIDGGCYRVDAVKKGIVGKDSVKVTDGVLAVTAGTDGISATNGDDAALGTVSILGGSLTVNAGSDAVQAETLLCIAGGTLNLTGSETSGKGLKAGKAIAVTGGTVSAATADDALHSNGDIIVSGGSLTLRTGDDGVHADGNLTVSGGSIVITDCCEGLEAAVLVISGGKIDITSTDDGLNAAGGANESGTGNHSGQDGFSGSTGRILVSGGYTVLQTGGDGIDSNGSIDISGGILLINGPTDNGNGAIDYDTDAVISGGTVIAVGSGGMAQNFSSAENQGSILVNVCEEAGTPIALCEEDGTALVSFTPRAAYCCAVISAPGIQTGHTYRIVTGGTAADADENGFAANTVISGGTVTETVTVDSLICGTGMGFRPGGPDENAPEMPGGATPPDGNPPKEPGRNMPPDGSGKRK